MGEDVNLTKLTTLRGRTWAKQNLTKLMTLRGRT